MSSMTSSCIKGNYSIVEMGGLQIPLWRWRMTGDESLLLEIFDKFVNELKEKAKEKERKRQEDKARKEKERNDREKKERQRRDKDRGDKSRKERDRIKKDGTDSEKAETYNFEEINRSGNERDKKHRKRHMSSYDDY